jgi:hypothetical protein
VRAITLPYRFAPRSYHRRIYAAFDAGIRHFLLILHRRSGKTKVMVNMVPRAAIQRVGNYAHVFPELKQANDVVWEGIDHNQMRYIQHFPEELLAKPPNRSEMRLTLKHPTRPALRHRPEYQCARRW